MLVIFLIYILFRRSPSRNRSPHPWRRSLRPWRRPGYRSRSPLGRKFSPGWNGSPSFSDRLRRTSSSSTITSSVGRYRSAERSDDRSRSPSTTTWSSSESNYSDYSSRSSRQRYRSLSRENYLATYKGERKKSIQTSQKVVAMET